MKRRAPIKPVREQVFERDGNRCRIPWCLRLAYTYAPHELAHLKARGMGGSRFRDTTANTIEACHDCHQGQRSLHSGHIKWRFLTGQGADGPMAFEWCEKLPTAECGGL